MKGRIRWKSLVDLEQVFAIADRVQVVCFQADHSYFLMALEELVLWRCICLGCLGLHPALASRPRIHRQSPASPEALCSLGGNRCILCLLVHDAGYALVPPLLAVSLSLHVVYSLRVFSDAPPPPVVDPAQVLCPAAWVVHIDLTTDPSCLRIRQLVCLRDFYCSYPDDSQLAVVAEVEQRCYRWNIPIACL